MAIQELSEKELDISYAQGLLEAFLDEKLLGTAYSTVQENLKTLVNGVEHYREKYLLIQQDYISLLEKYNQLTALSSGYLQLMQQQKEQIDGLLIEQQREFHRTGNEE